MVRFPPVGGLHLVLKGGHLQAQELVYRTHPRGVPIGQIVVHGDNVHTPTGKGVQVDRHGGDEGLAFSGLHLSDGALMQDDRAHDLDIEGTHAYSPARRLPRHREGLRHADSSRVSPSFEPASELRRSSHADASSERRRSQAPRPPPGQRLPRAASASCLRQSGGPCQRL